MKLVGFAFSLCALAAACASPTQAPAPSASRPIVQGESHSLASEILSGPREINVWTPPGYAQTDDRYNVLYVLDGGLEQDFPHIAGLGQLGALSWTYESLIVVGVKTENRRAELTAPPADARHRQEFPEAGHASDFRAFLEREVIPFIESRYRVGPRRALMGESLAGLFVVDTLLNQPALFDDYVAVSPSLWWDEQALSRDAARLLHADGRAGGRRFYLTIADEGGATQSGMDALLAALRATPDQTVSWTYVDRSASETHATIYHGAALDALRWLYARPALDYGPTPWFYLNPADRR
jgi:uncharacterized protein